MGSWVVRDQTKLYLRVGTIAQVPVPITVIQCSLGLEDRNCFEYIFFHRRPASELFLARQTARHGGSQAEGDEAIEYSH
jgi:hypothetical protein